MPTKDPEKRLAQKKRWYAKYRAREVARRNKLYHDKREEALAAAREQYKADPEKFCARKRDEYVRNPEKFRERNRNRPAAARKRANETQRKRLAANPELSNQYKQQARDYRKRKANEIKAGHERYYLANKTRILAKDRARRETKGEEIRARDRERYYASPAKKESIKRWALKNPAALAQSYRTRYAREHQAEGCHSAQDIEDLYARQQGMCAGCARPIAKRGPDKYHVDHYLALSRGGTNWPANLQLLCKPCNCSKGNASPEQWETVIKPRCIERRRTRDG